MTTNEQIQKVKFFLLSRAFNAGHYGSFEFLSEIAINVIGDVKNLKCGLPSDIAETVLTNHRISEKQAYWIAKASVENDIFVGFADANDENSYSEAA